MPTNEERRQVAARLRDARVKLESIPVPKSIGEQSFTYLLELTKAIGKHDGALFDHFADLIEPEERTCWNDSLKRGKGVFCCSKCGIHLDIDDMEEEDMDVFYEPRFCPNCGCRVEEES